MQVLAWGKGEETVRYSDSYRGPRWWLLEMQVAARMFKFAQEKRPGGKGKSALL